MTIDQQQQEFNDRWEALGADKLLFSEKQREIIECLYAYAHERGFNAGISHLKPASESNIYKPVQQDDPTQTRMPMD